MSDVYIAFGTLLSLGIVFPGLLVSSWLLFPHVVGRAEERLIRTPIRSFFLGLFLIGVLVVPILILANIPIPFAQFLAAAIGITALGVATLGAAGLTAWMSGRLAEAGAGNMSQAGAFLRAAVALELAAAFPIIGWFLFIPLCIIISLGAAAFALLNWRPRRHVEPEPRVIVRPAGAGDVS